MWRLGMTRTWTGPWGLMSWKASISSSWKATRAGMRPATISQNRHDTVWRVYTKSGRALRGAGGRPTLAARGPCMDRTAFFAGWEPLERTAVLAACAYVMAVSALRLYGKRTLASFNVFDLVVSIALGSVLASTALDSRVSLAQGVLAFVVLAGLQFLVEWLAVRSKAVRKLAHNRPTLIAYHGRMLPEVMER